MVARALEAEQVKNRDIWRWDKSLHDLGATEHTGLKGLHSGVFQDVKIAVLQIQLDWGAHNG